LRKRRLLKVLVLLSTYSSILPIAACLFKLPIINRRFYAILLYCILSLLTDLSFKYLHLRVHPDLQFFILSSFTILEYSLFSFFIYCSLINKILRLTVMFASILFISFCIIYYNRDRLNIFDSLPASLESLIIIVFCLFYFYEQISIPTVSIIYSNSTFWVIIGILFYLSGTLFLFLYVASLPKTQVFNHWYITNVFNILIKILFTIAFSLNKDDLPEKLPMKRQSYI